MKSAPATGNFNSGELSPLISGRADLGQYRNGARRMRNFIPAPQGPARRRMGTRFVAEVKDSTARTWLGRFVFNNAQSYVVEFGDRYCRFFSNHGVVGAPFELATPWVAQDLTDANGLFGLRMVQSGDVLFVVHRLYPPQQITRTSSTTFSIAPVKILGGPFKDLDLSGINASIYASAALGGGITLTASSNVFQPDPVFAPNALVGTSVRLEQNIAINIKAWEPGKVVALNDVRRSDGKNYHALNAGTTGAVKPIHVEGAVFDGDNGVQWQFDDAGYGWGFITAIADAQHCTVATTIFPDFPQYPAMAVGAGNATKRWALSSWNIIDGYPENVTIFRERLVFSRDRDVWGSVAGDFFDFRDRDSGGLITADQAFHFDTTSDRADAIMWLSPDNSGLIIGTGADEHVMYEASQSDPFGPGNAITRKQSEHGSRRVQPVFVDDSTMFVQNSGRKIRDMHLAESINIKWLSSDMNILAEHVGHSFAVPGYGINIVNLAYQQEPDSVLWATMADGRLAGFTINREQDIRGWHQHRIGGFVDLAQTQFSMVESIITIPSPDGGRNELWMIVKRNINGTYRRYVEFMETMRESGDNPEDAFYVDCGLSLDNTRAATLQPGVGADVAGAVNITFSADAPVFTVADVGKYIHHTYITEDVTGAILWKKAVALITAFTDTQHVLCLVQSPFPFYLTNTTPSGFVVAFSVLDPGIGYTAQPVLTTVGGGGTGATGITTLQAVGAFIGAMSGGAGYSIGDILTLNGGVFTHPAKFRVINIGGGGSVNFVNIIDGGDYSAIPGTVVPFGGVNLVQVATALSGGTGAGCQMTMEWGLGIGAVVHGGVNPYTSNPTVLVGGGGFLGKAASMAAIVDGTTLSPGNKVMTAVASGNWRISVTTISGLGHLEGQLVDVCADGAAHPQRVVTGGSISLASPASKVHVGLPCPAVLQPMPFETVTAMSQGNSTMGKTKRAHRVNLRFHESLGCRYGRDENGSLDTLSLRSPVNLSDQSLPLFTGDKLVSWPSGYDGQQIITIVADQPLPCTVVAISPLITTEDDR